MVTERTEEKTKLQELAELGQSVWLDSISRSSLTGGGLQKLIDEGLRGETANPTIFEKAISSSPDYDERIGELARTGCTGGEIYEALLVRDVQMACDLFRPLYDRLDGADGFVSLEVSPKLARDTQGTIDEVRRFWKWVDRPNLMIKIPGTAEGAPAIEQMLYEGVNVNITLLFAIQAYEQVAWAYVRALERRLAEGQEVRRIASVASFFVSRIDTLVDKLLDQKAAEAPEAQARARLQSLRGKAAIANAQLAYERFQAIFGDDRFKALAARGARVQRPLWASTSTKNPAYPDTLYVDTLIGPDTINTLPVETIQAVMDHGKLARTVDRDLEPARETFRQLEAAGIHMDDVTRQVLDEGIVKFDESLVQLLNCIESKRTAILAGRFARDRAFLGDAQRLADEQLAAAVHAEVAKKVWAKDAGLWTQDREEAQGIKNRLGWLTVADSMRGQVAQLAAFADQVRKDVFTHVVLCGMGGSSLGVEVLLRTFGTRSGFPTLHVLDTTDPKAIAQLTAELDVVRTLFVISSKSGTTAETRAHLDYFYHLVEKKLGYGAGTNFVAITDPGTPLAAWAKEHQFRRVFLNPADIGGRYSALSYFGLVPGALMGVDLNTLLERGHVMSQSCETCASPKQNPGLWLGVILGTLARRGRDKVTLVTSPGLESFGAWAEQLLAESTGKKETGIVPVANEPPGEPAVYGNDRLFVYLHLESTEDADTEDKLRALQRAGHPVVWLELADRYDLGAEFFRWEFATAVAGSILGINPFDEPNVTESKENTQRVLSEGMMDAGTEGVSAFRTAARFGTTMAEFLKQAQPGDYIAIMAYVAPTLENDKALQQLRLAIRDRMHVATTVGFGPRFLHSTGQLHKGGPNRVLALQIVVERKKDEAIPGEPYSFGQLFQAQSLGDWQSLQKHGRRALRVQLRDDAQLADLAETVGEAQAGEGKPRAARRGGRKAPVAEQA